jgi:O-antigen ligase
MVRKLDRFALTALGATLGYAVFQWGGVRRSDQYACLLALGLLGIALGLGRARGGWAPQPGRVVRWCIMLLPAYVLLQALPVPVAALRVLSPQRAAAVDTLRPIGAQLHFASLSVSPDKTFRHFLLVCGYVITFLSARELVWRLRHRRWLAIAPIVAIGAAEAGLGLWQCLGVTGDLPRWGTYVNHNHFAGFLEMALPFAVMYPVAVLRRPGLRWRAPIASSLWACGVWALAWTIFAAIVFSLSRMGFTSTLFSLLVIGIVALGIRQLNWVARSRRRKWCVAAIMAALVLVGFFFLPPDRLIQRFAQIGSVEGLTAEGRINLWGETIPLIRAYPVFGCGLGGYETAFLKFKVTAPLVTDDFAHNDYLQFLAELGLVGFMLAAALAFSVVKAALRRAVISPDRETRYFAVACMGALAAILLHSLADFNLYIPANAMLLAWISGMTLGNSVPPIRTSGWERAARMSAIDAEAIGVVSSR